MGHCRSLFLYFCLFNTVYSNVLYKSLLMTGFEPRISGIGSDHSTNLATTTAQCFKCYVRIGRSDNSQKWAVNGFNIRVTFRHETIVHWRENRKWYFKLTFQMMLTPQLMRYSHLGQLWTKLWELDTITHSLTKLDRFSKENLSLVSLKQCRVTII